MERLCSSIHSHTQRRKAVRKSAVQLAVPFVQAKMDVSPTPEADRNKNRLPTLNEVLQRRTQAPVDLFSFYIYMRDQQRSVDYLDFWCVTNTSDLEIAR